MASKWDAKYTLLVTAIARNVGPFGIRWDKVGEEVEETAKAAESAFWRLDKENKGQASIDARILKHRIKGTPYAKMLPDFPGYTVGQLKDRAAKLAGQSNNNWVEEERIGFLDIEADRLQGNMGIMLSWALKYRDGDVVHDAVTRDEATNKDKLDRRIVKSLVDELDNVDLIVTYYGTGFDLPFIRTRALIHDIPFFEYGVKKHYDLYYTVRSKMSLHSNRLAVATQTLDIEGKTPLPPSTWNEARLGYPEAIKEILEHNDGDVVILEELFNEISKFVKIVRKSV